RRAADPGSLSGSPAVRVATCRVVRDPCSAIMAEDAGADKDYARRLPCMARPLKPVPPAFVRWRPRSEHVPCVSMAHYRATIEFLEHNTHQGVSFTSHVFGYPWVNGGLTAHLPQNHVIVST